MAIKKNNKYADFEYKLSETERIEALWLIEQGDFKNLEDFIDSSRRAEIRIMKRKDAARKRKANIKKNDLSEAAKKQKAA